jgi:RNA recognition motif-containing protein
MRIYVGNLSPETTEGELRKAFQAHGEVSSVSLLTEKLSGGRRSGPSRGFGFVAMPDGAQARAALAALHHSEIHGRAMSVHEARAKRSYWRPF